MYNVHLPIMLESERQAVYRERKKAGVEGAGIWGGESVKIGVRNCFCLIDPVMCLCTIKGNLH